MQVIGERNVHRAASTATNAPPASSSAASRRAAPRHAEDISRPQKLPDRQVSFDMDGIPGPDSERPRKHTDPDDFIARFNHADAAEAVAAVTASDDLVPPPLPPPNEPPAPEEQGFYEIHEASPEAVLIANVGQVQPESHAPDFRCIGCDGGAAQRGLVEQSELTGKLKVESPRSRLKRRCGETGRAGANWQMAAAGVRAGRARFAFARCQANLVAGRRSVAAVPPSARWLLKESSRQPAYSPDGRLRPGLNVLEPGQWLLKDEDDAEIIAMKRAVLDDPQVGQSLWVSDGRASTVAAEEELYSLVAACQPVREPVQSRPLITAAARLVREDLILLRQHGDTPAAMCSACVCFSFGQLLTKLGAPLADIHSPVPGYAKSLRRPLDRIFAKLGPDKSFWRANFEFRWSGELLHPSARGDPSLKGDLSHKAGEPVDDSLGPADMYLRVEYQTLRRLPDSQHIAFTVRSYTDPLPCIAESPACAVALADRVNGLSPDFAAYKGISASMRPRIEAYLRR
ncbi:unnamed protein product [Symbiodinium necroappetens]|uniref:Uncharacterized protein n=1 Tax=Symbiodinium necroappetens TaxID=1628268 RepID=A0A812UMY0_9DINO|nr:unnamed protein product [Symbiodinium necroappetens]